MYVAVTPKPRQFKVVFVIKIIAPVLVLKARPLAYMVGVNLHGQYKTRSGDC